MFLDADWSQLFIDRWHEARQDVLDITNLFARIDAQTDPLTEAQAHNFEAHPNVLRDSNPGFPSPASDTWQEQVDFIKENWLSRRIAWIDRQFVPAPTTNVTGGEVADAVKVPFALPSSGILYFTLDGSDPRAAGGGVSSNAIMYTGGDVNVASTAQVTARVYDASVQPTGTGLIHTQWSAPAVSKTTVEFNPHAGDANRDPQFDTADIVQVLAANKYETGTPATFEEGDWNADGVFDQLDIVAALQTGNYLHGPYAAARSPAKHDTNETDTNTVVGVLDVLMAELA